MGVGMGQYSMAQYGTGRHSTITYHTYKQNGSTRSKNVHANKRARRASTASKQGKQDKRDNQKRQGKQGKQSTTNTSKASTTSKASERDQQAARPLSWGMYVGLSVGLKTKDTLGLAGVAQIGVKYTSYLRVPRDLRHLRRVPRLTTCDQGGARTTRGNKPRKHS